MFLCMDISTKLLLDVLSTIFVKYKVKVTSLSHLQKRFSKERSKWRCAIFFTSDENVLARKTGKAFQRAAGIPVSDERDCLSFQKTAT
jgi:hypothetical protein